MMNDTYGINIPYYITLSGFNSAIFFLPGALPWAILSQPYWGCRKLTLPLDYPDYHL